MVTAELIPQVNELIGEYRTAIEAYRTTVENYKARDKALGEYVETIHALLLTGDPHHHNLALNSLSKLVNSFK